jgi:hypothetical protein
MTINRISSGNPSQVKPKPPVTLKTSESKPTNIKNRGWLYNSAGFTGAVAVANLSECLLGGTALRTTAQNMARVPEYFNRQVLLGSIKQAYSPAGLAVSQVTFPYIGLIFASDHVATSMGLTGAPGVLVKALPPIGMVLVQDSVIAQLNGKGSTLEKLHRAVDIKKLLHGARPTAFREVGYVTVMTDPGRITRKTLTVPYYSRFHAQTIDPNGHTSTLEKFSDAVIGSALTQPFHAWNLAERVTGTKVAFSSVPVKASLKSFPYRMGQFVLGALTFKATFTYILKEIGIEKPD